MAIHMPRPYCSTSALAIYEKVFEPDHPNMVTVSDNYAVLRAQLESETPGEGGD